MSKTSFNRSQLEAMNVQADELLEKVQAIEAGMDRIGKLWESLPTADDLEELASRVDSIERDLRSIPDLVDQLPNVGGLEDLATKASEIAHDLASAAE